MTLNLYNEPFETEMLTKVFEAFNNTKEVITIYLRSGGGKVSIQNALTDFVNTNSERFEVVGFDYLASCAFIFFLKINCEKRLANDTIGMLHQIRSSVDLDEFNKPYYAEDESSMIRQKVQKQESQDLIKKLGLSPAEIKKYNKNDDLYFQYDRFLELIENYKQNK